MSDYRCPVCFMLPCGCRSDRYSELREALGCDNMDSHVGALKTARELRARVGKMRAALETVSRMSSTTKLRKVVLAALEGAK